MNPKSISFVLASFALAVALLPATGRADAAGTPSARFVGFALVDANALRAGRLPAGTPVLAPGAVLDVCPEPAWDNLAAVFDYRGPAAAVFATQTVPRYATQTLYRGQTLPARNVIHVTSIPLNGRVRVTIRFRDGFGRPLARPKPISGALTVNRACA
ncbi:MAG TPA: hypothetical protein VGQ84_14105 [Gaiellaceae bacterium]|jgi:hypothetical protein|nr:hypothetical protein [Gaiellaceae bacterium]